MQGGTRESSLLPKLKQKRKRECAEKGRVQKFYADSRSQTPFKKTKCSRKRSVASDRFSSEKTSSGDTKARYQRQGVAPWLAHSCRDRLRDWSSNPDSTTGNSTRPRRGRVRLCRPAHVARHSTIAARLQHVILEYLCWLRREDVNPWTDD
jgi:hypothetical protein